MKEFTFIDLLKKRSPRAPIGIGDDAALFGDFLITTDTMAEGIHFLPSEPVMDVADRLFQANLSDIAAMGGQKSAYYALLGLGGQKFISQEFAEIIADLCQANDIALIGGDTVNSGAAFLSLTLIGHRGKNVLTRSGAKAGDLLYLSREIGGARHALDERLTGKKVQFPRQAERLLGAQLGEINGITACIDISDGLGRDLAHIATASNVRIEVSADALPLWGGVSAEYAIASGEEYALTFTIDPEYPANLPAGLFHIGHITEGSGVFMNGQDISKMGYEHG